MHNAYTTFIQITKVWFNYTSINTYWTVYCFYNIF